MSIRDYDSMFLFGYICHWGLGQRPSTGFREMTLRAGPNEKLVTGYGDGPELVVMRAWVRKQIM